VAAGQVGRGGRQAGADTTQLSRKNLTKRKKILCLDYDYNNSRTPT
jgi:hypothetical protein